MSIKTILLTGSTGFIGSHLLKKLLEEKYKVIILKKSTSPLWRIEKLLPKTKHYNIDETDPETIFKNKKIDCLIHLATKYIKKHQTKEEVQEMIDININLPSVLSHLCIQYKVPYFLNTGTFFEYQIQKKPLTETDPQKPYNFYAATKTAFAKILEGQTQESSLKATTLYLSSTFGPKDNPKLFPFLIKSLLKNQEVLFSGGEQTWNFTYVKDIVSAYIKVLKNFPKLKDYETFLIGQPQPHSIKEIVSTLEKISKKKLNITWGSKPYIENEIFFASCSSKKAQEKLNWKPSYNLKRGLKETYNYYLKNQNRL